MASPRISRSVIGLATEAGMAKPMPTEPPVAESEKIAVLTPITRP